MKQAPTVRWQPAEPSLGERAWAAGARATKLAPALLALAVLYSVVAWTEREDLPDNEFAALLWLVAGGWLATFVFFLLGSSRRWCDRAFTMAGFFATFFGLATLLVFFFSLAGDTVRWFRVVPILVEQQNKAEQEKLDKLHASAEAQTRVLREEIAALEKERDELLRDTRSEDDKHEIRSLFAFGISKKQDDLAKKRAESQVEATGSIRPDTSRWGAMQHFLTHGTSKNAQDSGIGPALWGSLWLGLITLVVAVPIGIGAAIYLEEYRQEGWLAKVIQVNINNLAGVPSVVYGILGGFVFVYLFRHLEETFPGVAARNLLGGGMTLGLLTLPVIIVSAQEAIRAVPSSLRHGAYALGATKWQVIWTIVLPMARPGILTGTILSLSRAIGEAAPIVLLGASQYISQDPSLLTMWFKEFTAMPLQIFQWSKELPVPVELGDETVLVHVWKYNAALASAVLLILLLGMNGVAIVLRNRAQRKMRY